MVGEHMFPPKPLAHTSDPQDVVKEHTETVAAGCTAGPLIPSWYAAWGADGRGPETPCSCCLLLFMSFFLCIAERLEKDSVNLLLQNNHVVILGHES